MVAWAIKRSRGCFAEPACSWVTVAEQAQLRLLVGHAARLKCPDPHLFGAPQDLRHEMSLRIPCRWGLWLLVGGRLDAGGATAERAEDGRRMPPEVPPPDERDGDCSETDAMNGPEAATRASDVLNVLALALIVHSHRCPLPDTVRRLALIALGCSSFPRRDYR